MLYGNNFVKVIEIEDLSFFMGHRSERDRVARSGQFVKKFMETQET